MKFGCDLFLLFRDLQSYLSHLSIFLASESKHFYILVDNRPWLEGLVSRPAHLWQLMVTKSRLSPFANTRSRKGKKKRKEKLDPKTRLKSSENVSKSTDKWFSLINAAKLSQSRALLPMKKLRHSLQLNDKLHQTLFGLIIFEVSWNNVRGINYLNELQTDTSMAIETKYMRRWEFDSITQAANCMSSWFSGTVHEQNQLREYLLSIVVVADEVFYDVHEEFPMSRIDDDENICFNEVPVGNESHFGFVENFGVYPATEDSMIDAFHTPPPPNVPYKRRRLTKPNDEGAEFETPRGYINSFEHFENNIEASDSKDILILFRFSDADLPFKFREIIMSDLRLLTLLEAGLPSWVLFLQSYPIFCHMYRPWMCPLARALYVLVSAITVVIGFYDLYKNVPLLKATASHLLGPLFDWIETWEMVSRIKYLGTMLFLHNCEKAITWFLMMTRTIRSFFSVLAQPLIGPLLELCGVLLPFWNVIFQAVDNLLSVIWIIVSSTWNLVGDVFEIILFPFWFILSFVWSTATMVILPVFWMIKEVLYAPIRLMFGLANMVAFAFIIAFEVLQNVWVFIRGIFSVASVTKATVNTYEPSIWRSLWKDLFSQVFCALRSILNGLIAFFIACNRHRLSISNHLKEFTARLSGHTRRPHDKIPIPHHGGSTPMRNNTTEKRRKPQAGLRGHCK
ncbi:hypothetical protein V2J09_008699 [Rumex salicifolius]